MVASRMAPVASMTRKQAPNWRVATIRISMIGIAAAQLPRNHEHEGERANCADRDDEVRAEPVVLEPAVEHDLECAEKGRDQQEADEIEPTPPVARSRLRSAIAASESRSERR